MHRRNVLTAAAGFAAPLGHKDVRLALAAAEELRVPMPLASLLRDRFLTLLAQGGDNLDWSAIGGLAAKDAGLFSSDLRDGVAEVVLVIQGDVGDDGEQGVDDVGGVQTTAEADFQNGDVDRFWLA